MPAAVLYICAAMLFAGASPLPYGYYTLLRLVAFGVFAASAYISYKKGQKVLPWVLGLVAVIFNPIVKVHFPKEIWMGLDIAAGILLIAIAKKVK